MPSCGPTSGERCAAETIPSRRAMRPDLTARDAVAAHAGAPDTAADQAHARAAAAARRRRRQWQAIAIRTGSVLLVLALWQVFGARVDPVLFTTPFAVARAAVVMIASGELWTYLWPSLIVLAIGLVLAAAAGIAIGLLLARVCVLDVAFGVYVTFL